MLVRFRELIVLRAIHASERQKNEGDEKRRHCARTNELSRLTSEGPWTV